MKFVYRLFPPGLLQWLLLEILKNNKGRDMDICCVSIMWELKAFIHILFIHLSNSILKSG